MRDKEMFQNNLILLKEQKISHIVTLKRIPGLSALCRIFNQSILENDNNSMLLNKHYCVQLSMSEIYERMSKRTQKKYFQYQKGIATINTGLLRHDIRLLIIAEVIRKVDFKELALSNQAVIANKKKDFSEGKITDNIYACTPFYEVLDLNNSHFERLTKIKNKDISSYVIVQQMFGDQIADNCFNSTIRDYKNGLNTFGENSFTRIVDVIKKNQIVSIKDLSEYCTHNLLLRNGNHEKPAWWSRQLRTFNFNQKNITICRNSELSKEMQLHVHGNSLVFFYNKGR